jgi:hypothetical protein
MEDHIANNIDAFVEDGAVKANVKFFKTGPNAWVFDRLKENPNGSGPSIVGKAKTTVGEADGKKGRIVQRVPYLHAHEIVARPAAGGKVDAVYETEMFPINTDNFDIVASEYQTTTGSDGAKDSNLSEGLKEIIKRERERKENSRKYWELNSAFDGIVYDLLFANDDFKELSVDKRKALLKEAITEYQAGLLKLTFTSPLKPVKEDVNIEENITKLNKILEVVQEGEPDMDIKSLRLNDLKENPEVMAQLVEEVKKSEAVQEEFKNIKDKAEKLEKVETELTENATKLEESEKKVTALEAEKKALSESVDKYETVEKLSNICKVIEECKKEKDFNENLSTELFENELKAIVYEDEAKFKEAVNAKLDDRIAVGKNVAPPKKVIEGVNSQPKVDENDAPKERTPNDVTKLYRNN